jgi:hypothetical protein
MPLASACRGQIFSGTGVDVGEKAGQLSFEELEGRGSMVASANNPVFLHIAGFCATLTAG